ncbi:MAG TPA: hypothetical protein VFQ23_12645 [Anaerolineales bacterium]|nr:hypothetical protein [Anaerolineales bacterium]
MRRLFVEIDFFLSRSTARFSGWRVNNLSFRALRTRQSAARRRSPERSDGGCVGRGLEDTSLSESQIDLDYG